MRANRLRQVAALALLVAPLCGAGSASASSGQRMRTVTYHGYSVEVPRSWPVLDLARAPHTCVRFNRHALYLGTPGGAQHCPANAVGRTEAILIEPERVARAADGTAPPLAVQGAASTFAVPVDRVKVIATWRTDPQLIAHALHRRSLPAVSSDAPAPRIGPRNSGGGSAGPSSGGFYTGPGFDVCDVPSTQQMPAWTDRSPYHAIGVYVGGENAACPPGPGNPNLTANWLNTEAAAGWHFIPIYVGLQAPHNGCGCAAINPSQAASQGTADADQAVAAAQSLGLPSGTPIYDDMEGYADGGTNTSAVLAFLAAWTTELHARGYLSGVYGSIGSTIHDLATQYGTSYQEPDDIWFAAWPGAGTQTTADPNIPSADWASHQRLHQYSGGHNETYGGVTLNIDGDYLDGAVAGSNTSAPPALAVSRSGGTTSLTASWSGLGLARWEVLAGSSASALTGIRSVPLHGFQTTVAVRSAAPYFAIQAIGPSNQVLATSAPVAAPNALMLFSHSSFVGERSLVGTVPVGCYLATGCQIVASVLWGSVRLARSAAQTFRPGGSGLVYYRLNWAGRKLLAKYHDVRLPVQVMVTDQLSGTSTRAGESLVPFATNGGTPARGASPSPFVSVAGTTDFVHGWAGGVLVHCATPGACWVTASLSSGTKKIASAGPQLVGGLELGYVYFSLTAKGRQLFSRSSRNQVGASLVLHSGSSTASARLALVQF